jgi:hypothetical protein
MLYADPCAEYRLYANIADAGNPPAGISSVTADLSAVTSAATAVPLTAGSYVVGGVAYGYRSAPLFANVQPGSYAYSINSVDGAGTHVHGGLTATVGSATMITPAWLTGFNAGVIQTPDLFSANQGGIVDTSGGNNSLKIAKASGASAYTAKTGFTAATSLSLALKLVSLPVADVKSLAYLNTSSVPLYLGYQAAPKKLTLQWGSNTAAAASSVVAAGTWVVVELRVDVGVNPNTAAWRVDSVDQSPVSLAAAAQTVTDFRFGSAVSTDAFTAHYDDIVHSASLFDYPIGRTTVSASRPNGMGAQNTPSNFQHEDGSAIASTTYLRLDDEVLNTTADGVRQVVASVGSYLQLTMSDTTATCVRAVQATVGYHKGGAPSNSMVIYLIGPSPNAQSLLSGDGGSTSLNIKSAVAAFGTESWSPSSFNGLMYSIGNSSDVAPQPYWDALVLEVATRTE